MSHEFRREIARSPVADKCLFHSKTQFFQTSHDEIRDLTEGKDSANTQKTTKSVVATLFIFCLEVSAEE